MTLKLVSVTRVLNEDDVIEAFVRHNIWHLDRMIFLDNGSTDNTLPILRALQGEGLPIVVFATSNLIFDEVDTNTRLYGTASQTYCADWVVFLDADEFLAVDGTLPALLAAHKDHGAINLNLRHYFRTREDDADEPVVPLRLRWRAIQSTEVTKIVLRGGLPVIRIEAGNHGAAQNGTRVRTGETETAWLAHYPERNAFQALRKAVIGRLKVLAAGDTAEDAGWSGHYKDPFHQLRDTPAALLRNQLYVRPVVNRSFMQDKPLAYLGGAPRYPAASDAAETSVRLLLEYIESLRRQYAGLLDMWDQAKRLDRAWTAARIDRFPCYERMFKRLLRAQADAADHLDGERYYSAANDQALTALQLCVRYAETLANRHGKLLDEMPQVKTYLSDLNAQWPLVF
jgi:hypothetical protein